MARRERRLRRVATWAVVFAGVAAGVWLAHRWTRPPIRRPGEELPEITRKLALDLPSEAPLPSFTDVTAEAGLADFVSFRGPRSSQLPEDMGSGAAWGDFDRDGDDDLFLVAAAGALSRPPSEWARSGLWENLGDATFRRLAGVDPPPALGMAAAWGDADGDGRLDLALSGYRFLALYRNTADGFTRDPNFPSPPGYWAGVAWGDFDNDRDLDLYVCGYVRYEEDGAASRRLSEQYGAAVPYTLNPASFEPERNLLFENSGDGTFDEVAELWGVSNPGGRSLSAVWHDFDDDGRLDLYVANDISDNALYLNRGETFEDAGLSAWVADYRGAMGLAVGDWNRDGDDDLFVTHWLAQENALYDSRWVDFERQRREAGGVMQLSFSDLSAPLGLGQPALQLVGWGTEFADFDADGWLDIAIANGSTLETSETQDGAKTLRPQPDMLFWNRRGEAFHDLAPLNETLSSPTLSRGLAVSDYDLDGDQDLLIARLDAGVTLLRNDMAGGSWLELRLRSLTAAGEPLGWGDGSTVTVEAGGGAHRRSVGGASYLSQSSRTLHFGLGAAQSLERVTVKWLAGEAEVFGGVEPGAVWELVEGEGVARRVAARVAVADREPLAEAPSRSAPEVDRQRVVEFWRLQREAMDLVKLDGDCEAAESRFRAALELDPAHEDSRYYLANCLARMDRAPEALAELDTLRRISPGSHRAHKQWGVLKAINALGDADLEAAERAIHRSLEINPEETGGLLVLGELALLQARPDAARRHLELACRTNPRAVGGFFLRAYLAWSDGRPSEAAELLAAARQARGEEWKPAGTVAEGDVKARQHREETPLSRFVDAWDGSAALEEAFAELDRHLGPG